MTSNMGTIPLHKTTTMGHANTSAHRGHFHTKHPGSNSRRGQSSSMSTTGGRARGFSPVAPPFCAACPTGASAAFSPRLRDASSSRCTSDVICSAGSGSESRAEVGYEEPRFLRDSSNQDPQETEIKTRRWDREPEKLLYKLGFKAAWTRAS